MARCETCGNDYDKSFQVMKDGQSAHTTASNARSMLWLPFALIRTLDGREPVCAAFFADSLPA